MGKINLLKNGYRGKVGQTVGQQWNGELTLRVHNEHNYSKSEAQLAQRADFFQQIKISSVLSQSTFNFHAPKGSGISDWNFLVKSSKKIISIDIRDPNPVDVRGNSKKGLIFHYPISTPNGDYIVIQNVHDNFPYRFDNLRFYGVDIFYTYDTTKVPILEAARATALKKNFPPIGNPPQRNNTLLVKCPVPLSSTIPIYLGLILKKGSQDIYTEIIPALKLIQLQEDQLIDW